MSKQQKELEGQNVTLLQAKNDLFVQVQAKEDTLADCEEKITKLVTQRSASSLLSSLLPIEYTLRAECT